MQPRLQQAIALANSLPPDAQDNLANTIFQEIANHQSLRHLLLQMPLEQRHQILAAQAEAIAQHYQENTDWQELGAGDFINYDFPTP